MTPSTSDALDVGDPQAVSSRVHRLRAIATELARVRSRADALYAERMALVHELRGHVSQQDLAQACRCSVDMVKNISTNARRKYGDTTATL